MRTGLNLLKAHKQGHNFKDPPSDACICGNGPESSIFYLFIPCSQVSENFCLKHLCQILFHGIETLNPVLNRSIRGHFGLCTQDQRTVIYFLL